MGFILNPIVDVISSGAKAVGKLVGIGGKKGGSSGSQSASPAVRRQQTPTQTVTPRSSRQTDVAQALLQRTKGGGAGGVAVGTLGASGGGFGDEISKVGYKTLLGK